VGILKGVGETLAGILIAVLTLPFILFGLFVSLFELPRYLRIKGM
jgi:hypothetical protein